MGWVSQQSAQKRKKKRRHSILQSLRRARAEHRAQHQRQIARGRLQEQFLVHVLPATHMEPPPSSGFKLMRKRSLRSLAALPQ
jgi:hypothetical protein